MSLLTDTGYEMVAGYFRVLSDPLRLKLLNTLQAGERTVAQLMAATGGNQANVSKHLRVLLDAGLVVRRKAGTNAWYGIGDPAVHALCEIVCARQEAFLRSRAGLLREELPPDAG
ncbi:MAG: metalloregulator ArsR/SmtB family transcription factor [Candidatus Sericytochromatia bacterium]|nr:metalloregulator ArsR/SmtB family transcription factor [Candidatus Sericytochromatia bacterium]